MNTPSHLHPFDPSGPSPSGRPRLESADENNLVTRTRQDAITTAERVAEDLRHAGDVSGAAGALKKPLEGLEGVRRLEHGGWPGDPALPERP